ncbi:Dabb family protein [Porphyromonas gingivalis]|uniref:Dabb family protein n=1 Tax=Porphyromonas gingivalis TaxID=837 RepID=UPI000BE725A6|nr:Dabb family protein [Porphyromonas gingivalis]MDH7902828.1 Dabb family protein [Porphyromonas gingivalis]PDP48550.1 stress responsive protein [Porphyromonas gingivalis]
MIKHIVMFKLAGFDSAEAKMKHLHRIKDALEALVQVIEPLRSMSVCLNMNPSEEYDLMLEADLNSLADVKAYAEHPAHTAVVRELIAPYKAGRACIDFEI